METLVDVGFEPVELASHWNENSEVNDDDFEIEKELKKIKEPLTQLGDLVIMGEHRLICGDSTDPTVVKKLFEEKSASMIYSDPVYNIQIDYNAGIGGKKSYGGSVQDNRSEADYRKLIKKSMETALLVSKQNAHIFYWCDQKYIWLIQTLYQELGIDNKRVCLWIKNGHNPTPGVAFNKCYEPCVYGTRGKPSIAKNMTNLTEVLNKDISTGNAMLEEISDIWSVKRLAGQDYEHATSKPPQLHQKAILRCTKPGEIILDSFSGSGSTLIACEQLKRRVYGIELEPVFCDLIIRRWERLTGGKATIIKGDEKAAIS